MYQKPKSATTAGLLGIFLGAFGVHNFYLGQKKNGIIHCCLFGGGIILTVVAGILMAQTTSLSSWMSGTASTSLAIGGILGTVAPLVMSASGIWGLIEGIIILTKGDAGLAQKGIPVATLVMPQYSMNNMNGMNGMNQNNMNGMNMNGMNGMSGMNQNNINNTNNMNSVPPVNNFASQNNISPEISNPAPQNPTNINNTPTFQ